MYDDDNPDLLGYRFGDYRYQANGETSPYTNKYTGPMRWHRNPTSNDDGFRRVTPWGKS